MYNLESVMDRETSLWATDASTALLMREAGLEPDNQFEREMFMDTVFDCPDVRKRYASVLALFISTALQARVTRI